MAKSFEDIRNSPLMRSLEASNWKSDNTFLHKFDSNEELKCYLHRTEEGEWWNDEKGRYDFERCVFNLKIHFGLLLKEFESKVYFEGAHFKHEISFREIIFKDEAKFNSCIFEKYVNFEECYFRINVDFSEVKFKNDFRSCQFYPSVSFALAEFEKDTYFLEKTFNGQANFMGAIFKKDINFSQTKFKKELLFHETIVENGNLSFEQAEFNEKVNAWNIQCSGDICFQWANFRKKANFTRLNAANSRVNFIGANFEGNAYFYDAKINILDLEKSVIDKGVFFLNASINDTNRETYRIIKHEFIKQDNKIEALKYYAKEMAEYETELFGTKRLLKYSVIRFFHDFRLVFAKGDRTNKFIVFINRISNGFNSKPFRGIGFTLVSSIIFYWLFLFILKIENDITFFYSYKYLGVNFKQILQLLNITNWNYHPFCLYYDWAYGVLVVGRIVVGYGIYQTIQAFRKFGKP